MTSNIKTPVRLANKGYKFLEFDQWETTNRTSFIDPAIQKLNNKVKLAPIKKAPKLTGVGVYESESHFALELPQKMIKEMLKKKRNSARSKVAGIKLKKLVS